MGCHALLQAIFLTQGSNPGLLQCKQVFILLATPAALFQLEGLLHLVVEECSNRKKLLQEKQEPLFASVPACLPSKPLNSFTAAPTKIKLLINGQLQKEIT